MSKTFILQLIFLGNSENILVIVGKFCVILADFWAILGDFWKIPTGQKIGQDRKSRPHKSAQIFDRPSIGRSPQKSALFGRKPADLATLFGNFSRETNKTPVVCATL